MADQADTPPANAEQARLQDAKAHRQSALAAARPGVAEDQAFVDAISWLRDQGGGEGDE